jgi:hypothetical protein
MNKDQIEMAKIFLEVLTHIRQQIDIYRENEDTEFAIISAFESGEVMLETRIQASEFVLDEEEIAEDREKAVGEWSFQFRRECDEFCEEYELGNRIKNPLMRLGDLTRQSRVPYTNFPDPCTFKIVNAPLHAKALKPDLPVDKYPKFLDVVREIVSNERPVAQIGEDRRNILEWALLKELARRDTIDG